MVDLKKIEKKYWNHVKAFNLAGVRKLSVILWNTLSCPNGDIFVTAPYQYAINLLLCQSNDPPLNSVLRNSDGWGKTTQASTTARRRTMQDTRGANHKWWKSVSASHSSAVLWSLNWKQLEKIVCWKWGWRSLQMGRSFCWFPFLYVDIIFTRYEAWSWFVSCCRWRWLPWNFPEGLRWSDRVSLFIRFDLFHQTTALPPEKSQWQQVSAVCISEGHMGVRELVILYQRFVFQPVFLSSYNWSPRNGAVEYGDADEVNKLWRTAY